MSISHRHACHCYRSELMSNAGWYIHGFLMLGLVVYGSACLFVIAKPECQKLQDSI